MRTANAVVHLRVVCLCVVFTLALAHGAAFATTYVVNPEGTGDFATIQAAVDSAGTGDVILLADGTYTGPGNRDIVVPAVTFTIRSESWDAMVCIIDCQGSAREEHRGFHFTPGDAIPWLEDVAVINGYTTTHGGGIWIEGVDAVLADVIIANCTAEGDDTRGGGLYVSDGADVLISLCTITGNSGGYGGGVSVWSAGGNFDGCLIGDNEVDGFQGLAGGVYATAGAYLEFSYCRIVSNTAPRAGGVRMFGNMSLVNCEIARNDALYGHSGGVWLLGGTVSNCTIVENSAASDAAGVYCFAGTGAVENSIIAFNGPGFGVGADEGQEPTLTCCDVYGNPDGNYDAVVGDQTGIDNNFSQDPEFCWFDGADYRLYDTSPCLASVSPCGQLVGALDQGCDSPVEESSWGKVKALYR
ncbi:MAG: right-handed parallel beta-helix repeat-containing protein [Candidatus Eisenbacteria bacterium]